MREIVAREIVHERSGGACELRIPDVCYGKATNYSHRKGKAQCSRSELWLPSNGVDACGSGTTGCHGYLHSNPSKAYSYGWMCRSGIDPHQMPIYLWTGHWTGPEKTWVHLDDLGGVEPISYVELVALSQLLGFGVA